MHTRTPSKEVTEVPGKEGYGDLTDLPKVPGTGTEVVQNFQKFRVLWHRRTELTEVPSGYNTCCTRTPGIVARACRTS